MKQKITRFAINQRWMLMNDDIVVDMVVSIPKGTIAEVYGKSFTGPGKIKINPEPGK